MKKYPVVIIGAGPAGLTAAYELGRQGIKPIVLEKANKVGGISRTETYKGYYFDIGGHRFYTKVQEIQQLWQEILGAEFIKVPRLSRIYYQGRFFQYPLSLLDTLSKLGIWESFLVLLSYLKVKWQPLQVEENLEQWVINRFGEHLYQIFFKTYTEKVWGIPCNQIQAEWAAQRIKGLSVKTVVSNALFGNNHTKTLIKEFDYPVLGPGMMWERCAQKVEEFGGEVCLDINVLRLEHEDNRITKVIAERDGSLISIAGDNFISSMPVTSLIKFMEPAPPSKVLEAASQLKYRDFLIVALVIDVSAIFPDNWIYIHDPEMKVGRIQNFKNWSAAMVPDNSKTCLGMEYFCNARDTLWNMSDAELIELGKQELENLGLASSNLVSDGVVIRQPKAYPVYDGEYQKHLKAIQKFLTTIENLQTTGRNGMHRYNNQDHSMLTGLLAAKNILGEKYNLWEVNTERSYYEEFISKSNSTDNSLAIIEPN
jgi:protoporphyrinogen oxidase